MAINPTPLQTKSNVTYSGTSLNVTFDSTPTAGNILLAISSIRQAGGAISYQPSPPSGFSIIEDAWSTNFNHAGMLAWKIAAGTESGAQQFTVANTCPWHAVLMEFAVTDLVAEIEDSSEDASQKGNSSCVAIPTGTATLSASAGLAIAAFCVDQYRDYDGGRSYSNSYVEKLAMPPGDESIAGIYVATKVLASAGDTSCTFSTTDTGGQAYGAQALFAAAAASAGMGRRGLLAGGRATNLLIG